MRKIVAVMLVCLSLFIATGACAGLNYDSDKVVSMLEKSYEHLNTDSLSYTFSFSDKYNAYFAYIKYDNIVEMADKFKDGTADISTWEQLREAMVNTAKTIKTFTSTLTGNTDSHVMVVLCDSDDNGGIIVLTVSDGEVISDYVETVDDGK